MSGIDQVFVALFLFLTMFGMGSTLTVASFVQVARRPLPLLIGLASQFGWMPLIAYGLARGLALDDPLALGLILMGASSGGTTSNLFTYLARADLALSISMTVTSTVAALVAMPVVLWLYATPFTSAELTIPYRNIILTLVAVLVPVSLGVLLRSRSTLWARRAERIGSIAGMLVILLVIVGSAIRDWDRISEYARMTIFAGTVLGPIGFALGWLGARLTRQPAPRRRAIALETGIQNVPLVIGIVIASFPGAVQDRILQVPLMYGVLVVPASAVLAWAFRRSAPPPRAGLSAGPPAGQGV